MRLHLISTLMIVSLIWTHEALSQTFIPTSGNQLWDVNSNWDTNASPDASSASATVSFPTADLSIEMGEPITVGTLTINKTTSSTVNVTLTANTPGSGLEFAG